MSKRTILMVVSIVASLALAATGTLAYLSDSDMDVNVMTLGKVDIVQNEQERRDDGTLNAFTDNKPLLPAVFPGSSIPYAAESEWPVPNDPTWRVVEDNENVVDKFVTVTNTGKTDAYVRTIVAVEAGCVGADTLIHTVQNDANSSNKDVAKYFADYETLEQITIDGVIYDVLVFTYAEPLEPGETSVPSLKQIYMNKAADNDFVETLGEKFDVLVLSQAVQADGFAADGETPAAVVALTEAFGDITEANVQKWFAEGTIETDDEDNNPPVIVPETNWQVEGDPDTAWYDEADPAATTYEVGSAEELAGLAKLVNEGNTFKGKTVELTADIDLDEHQWTPIGTSSNQFTGNFDGGNHTISNLMVDTADKSNVGLFGFTTNGSVKNLTVDNAYIKGDLNVGVIAGTPYTTKYDNITITGDVFVNGDAYVGGAFGKNVYANVSNITINASGTSYVRAESGNYRTYVGGVMGFVGEGGHTISNVTSNIDVYGSTCDVGGITGIAHYGNNFVNCSSSGDVKITAGGNDGYTDEIGGIAGVWHNQSGQKVTLDGCSFTGTLATNVDSIDLSDNTLTGRRYLTSGTGELIIK